MELDKDFYNQILAIINNNLSIEKYEFGYYIKGKSECAKYLYDTVKQAVENVLRFLDSTILKESVLEEHLKDFEDQLNKPYSMFPIMPDSYFLRPFEPDNVVLDTSELYVIGNVKFDEEKA